MTLGRNSRKSVLGAQLRYCGDGAHMLLTGWQLENILRLHAALRPSCLREVPEIPIPD